MIFHWLTAAAFLSAYLVVYYVMWIVDPETSMKPPLFGMAPQADQVVPVLNLHWMLGISMGLLVLPRLVWRLLGTRPGAVGSRLEHLAAETAHVALYLLLVLMAVSGYANTYDPTDFGLFTVPAFKDTSAFAVLAATFGFDWKACEHLMEAVHRFTGTWIALPLVGVHIAAALVHHFIRRDGVLRRMLP